MRLRTKKPPRTPSLAERLVASDCHRVAVVGLHAGAGARTVVQSLAEGLQSAAVPVGVTRAPTAALDGDDVAADASSRVVLPAGVVVATAKALAGGETALEPLDAPPDGDGVGIYRVTEAGPVPVQGPDDAEAMSRVVERLERATGGRVLVGGHWERRSFAAPGVTHGMVLVVSSGCGRSPLHAAAAVRYMIDTLTVLPVNGPVLRAWEQAAETGRIVLLDGSGRRLGDAPCESPDPVGSLRAAGGDEAATVALPNGLHDALLAPLVRSSLRFTLVVRDPTRVHGAPVYLKAWLKGRGAVHVVRPARLLAVATNPLNAAGPNADPAEFRRLVSEAAPGLPVHDVVLESNGSRRKKAWMPWTS